MSVCLEVMLFVCVLRSKVQSLCGGNVHCVLRSNFQSLCVNRQYLVFLFNEECYIPLYKQVIICVN